MAEALIFVLTVLYMTKEQEFITIFVKMTSGGQNYMFCSYDCHFSLSSLTKGHKWKFSPFLTWRDWRTSVMFLKAVSKNDTKYKFLV